jgi:hypothetical protein
MMYLPSSSGFSRARSIAANKPLGKLARSSSVTRKYWFPSPIFSKVEQYTHTVISPGRGGDCSPLQHSKGVAAFKIALH